ncbi:MAG: mechanosensitive ion channel [Cyanobacteria bacterium]|jgi:small conductance mechanosensitive channel|nr:mechanosensitive ion channel [Cyanobacteria bacterium GSL.Bin21]
MFDLTWLTLSSRQSTVLARRIALTIGALILTVSFFSMSAALSQLPEPKLERLVNTPYSINHSTDFAVNQSTDFAVGEVHLDGRQIFALAAPALSSEQQDALSMSPIQQRVEAIRSQLLKSAKTSLDHETLNVTYQIDTATQLPIISINDHYLMTVTSADARLYGLDTTTHAQNLIEIIREALIAFKEERQPAFLMQQGLRAAGILVSVFLLSLVIFYRQRYITSRYQALLKELEVDSPTDARTESISWSEQTEKEEDSAETIEEQQEVGEEQQKVAQQQQLKFWYEVRQRLLQLAQIGLWGGGLTLIVSLFPQTRWMQSIALSGLSVTFLKLLLLGLIAYIIVRISFVSIDRFIAALSRGRFLPAKASVRTVQRLQTFSGAVKGASAFVIVTIGFLNALLILGVNIVPLLAGASILGVAISFGSQSLVKDMINGLFILLEDQYGVGDVITANGEMGLVEKMNLRITQLRGFDGDLITIPNSSIAMVKNHTSEWSRVNLAIDVAYKTDLNHAIAVIEKVALKMSRERKWRELILESPKVLGVDKFGDNSITIRIWIHTQPLKQWEVGREFRRRLKYAFDAEGISIPFPQRSLWFENSLQSVPHNNSTEEHL